MFRRRGATLGADFLYKAFAGGMDVDAPAVRGGGSGADWTLRVLLGCEFRRRMAKPPPAPSRDFLCDFS